MLPKSLDYNDWHFRKVVNKNEVFGKRKDELACLVAPLYHVWEKEKRISNKSLACDQDQWYNAKTWSVKGFKKIILAILTICFHFAKVKENKRETVDVCGFKFHA